MDNVQDVHWVMPTGVSDVLAGAPISDFVGTSVPTDTVCFKKYNTAYFLIINCLGTAGTHAITAIPYDSVGGTATTAIPFMYKRCHTTDTNTAWAWATSNTVTTTAGSDQIYIVKVSADDLPIVSGVKYEYCSLLLTAVDSTAVLGGCIIMMADPRYAQDTTETVIT